MALQEDMRRQGNWLFKYRGILPIIILLIGFGLYLLKETNPKTILGEGTVQELIYNFTCLAIGFLGLFIRVHVVGHGF